MLYYLHTTAEGNWLLEEVPLPVDNRDAPSMDPFPLCLALQPQDLGHILGHRLQHLPLKYPIDTGSCKLGFCKYLPILFWAR